MLKKSDRQNQSLAERREERIERINASMITHAREIAKEIHANAVLVYVDVIKSEKNLKSLIKGKPCILAARSEEVIDDLLEMEGASWTD